MPDHKSTLLATVRIPVYSTALARLTSRVGTLNDRLEAAEIPARYTINAVSGTVWVQTAPGKSVQCSVVSIYREESGPVQRARFVARVNHLKDQPDGTKVNEVQLAPDVARVPGLFSDIEPYCDHCQTRRKRIRTLMVAMKDTGKIVQLGAGCVGEYLGRTASFWSSIVDAELDISGMITEAQAEIVKVNREYLSYSTPLVMALAVRQPAQPTHTLADDAETVCNDPAGKIQPPTTEELTRARQVWDWIAEMTPEVAAKTDLNVAQCRFSMANPAISRRDIYFAQAAVRAYNKLMSVSDRRRRFINSKHQGSIGERSDLVLELLFKRSFISDYGFGPRTSWLISACDAKDNVYSAYCSYCPDVNVGATFKARATVKAHVTYEGILETRLTRVKITGIAEPTTLTLASETTTDNLPF